MPNPYHQPHLSHLAPPVAIFSPSVARIAASAARDWNYIDSWLGTKIQGRAAPSFERNPDTLRALLALAAFSEASDEDQDALIQAEAYAVDKCAPELPPPRGENEVEATGGSRLVGPLLSESILDNVEVEITNEGTTALTAMATMASTLGMAHPKPETFGYRIVGMQAQAHTLGQTSRRVNHMLQFLETELREFRCILEELEGDYYNPPTDLARRNLELQKTMKSMDDRLPEIQNSLRSLALRSQTNNTQYTAQHIQEEELHFTASLSMKRDREFQVTAFEGLSSDPVLARVELDRLRSKLAETTHRRDLAFEGLVERASPKKRLA